MKKIIPAAMIIAATLITFASCEWLSNSHKKSFSIVGKWKVDSVSTVKKDSGSFTPLLPAFINSIKDSATLQFNADSTFSESGNGNVRQYYLKDSALFIKADSVFTAYNYHYINDSCISIVSTDSSILHLKKQ